MQPIGQISDALRHHTDPDLGRKRGRHIRPLRGLRGVSGAGIVDVLVGAWRHGPPDLMDDAPALQTLFTTAFEDGIVALGLVAAVVPDDPGGALELAWEWLEMVDEVETADVLGGLVLGPALMASSPDPADELIALRQERRPAQRRVALAAARSALPLPITGPAAAALRARLGTKHIAFVAEPHLDLVSAVSAAFYRDDAPLVRKAWMRLQKDRARFDPEGVEALLAGWRGGAPKAVRTELDKAIKKGRRMRAQAAAAAAAEE